MRRISLLLLLLLLLSELALEPTAVRAEVRSAPQAAAGVYDLGLGEARYIRSLTGQPNVTVSHGSTYIGAVRRSAVRVTNDNGEAVSLPDGVTATWISQRQCSLVRITRRRSITVCWNTQLLRVRWNDNWE